MLGQMYTHRRLPPYPGMGYVPLGQLGQAAGDVLSRAAAPLLDPVYAELERRAVLSIKTQIGPYIVGGFVALIAWNIWVTRLFAKKTRTTLPSPV